MTKDDILKKIKRYFSLTELVSNRVFDRHGESAWMFIDIDLLHTLLVIREGIGKPITVNTGGRQQRGLRENVCPMLKEKASDNKLYLSAHTMGKAVDFDVKGMKAEEVRDWIQENEDLLPCKIRLEHKFASTGKTISWVHLDVYYTSSHNKIHLFNV